MEFVAGIETSFLLTLGDEELDATEGEF